MGAFIGDGDVGVWASNGERDGFLDWFAENRCVAGDPKWELCRSDAFRWPGCDVDLDDLIPRGEVLALTDSEYDEAKERYGSNIAQLLGIIESITRGDWQIRGDSKAAVYWHRPEGFQKQFGF